MQQQCTREHQSINKMSEITTKKLMALNGQLGRHPSMAHFIKVIKKDAIKFDGLAARLDAGETVGAAA